MTSISGPGFAARTPKVGTALLLVWRRKAVIEATLLTVLGASIALFILAMARTRDLHDMNDIGLISILRPLAFVAYGLLATGFVLSIQNGSVRAWIPAFYLVVLIVVFHGLPSILEDIPRFHVAWRHAGVAQQLADSGIDPSIDAYFSWPGFFALLAGVSRIAGLDNPMGLAGWAPVAFQFGNLAIGYLLFSSLLRNRRAVWMACWLFITANWVGQDYLSPQAHSYFLFLAVMTIVLRWFPQSPNGGSLSLINTKLSMTVLGASFVMMLAIVMTHQLTPYALATGLGALALTRKTSARLLPVFMLLLTGTFSVFWARGYFAGHLPLLLERVTEVGDSFNSNVTNRVQGSEGHLVAVLSRLTMAAVVWGLGAVGVWRSRKEEGFDTRPIILAFSPLLLVVLQPYGGEMLMRSHLFALPFVAAVAGVAVFPDPAKRWGIVRISVLSVLLTALLGVSLIARFGNERSDWFSRDELAGVQAMYNDAPAGSALIAFAPNVPWRFDFYIKYRYRVLSAPIAELPALVVSFAHSRPAGCTYLLITRSQIAHLQAMGIWSDGDAQRVTDELVKRNDFERIHVSADATVYRFGRLSKESSLQASESGTCDQFGRSVSSPGIERRTTNKGKGM